MDYNQLQTIGRMGLRGMCVDAAALGCSFPPPHLKDQIDNESSLTMNSVWDSKRTFLNIWARSSAPKKNPTPNPAQKHRSCRWAASDSF